MKNILLVICPPFWNKLPPLGLAYVKRYLDMQGWHTDIVDLNVEKKDIILLSKEYNAIGFSIFKSNESNSLKLAHAVKKVNSKIKIFFGGPQCFSWQHTMTPKKALIADIVFTGDIFSFKDLDLSPDFSGFNLEKYERKRALPILSSRGCFNECAFCSERLLTPDYCVRKPENTLNEIRYNKNQFNTKWFTFHDSLINGRLDRLERLCDLISGENIVWDAQAIIRKDMTKKLLIKMKQSGCFNLFIGLESGSERTLKLMKKNFTIDEAEHFFKMCNDIGLHFEISLIAGFPGEREEDFKETLNFIKRNKNSIPKIAQINPFIKYPGTDVKSVPIQKGLERVKRLINTAENAGIKYTGAFINNLVRGT